ncbi:MAG: hypothetical protein P8166_02055 [Candidatus Thiodiazotropha sp.]|jgi:uncharacterized protein (DUF302 family)
MRVFLTLWILMLGTGCALADSEPARQTQSMRIYSSAEPFEDVVENVKMAIIDQGLLVSGTLHVSDMLNRTAPDLGFSEIFKQAESVEFCSALISHKMAQAAPENIVNCPFTIAVYVRLDEPGRVYLAYRLPQLAGDAKEAGEAILEMLDGIVRESI